MKLNAPTAAVLIMAVLLAALVCGCGGTSKRITPLTDSPGNRDADEIYEAVFRFQMKRMNVSFYKVCFLSVDRGEARDEGSRERGEFDPSDDFLSRFSDVGISVEKVSECTGGAKGVFDKKTGAQGLILKAGAITRRSESLVEVEGGYYAAGLSASGNTYTLENRAGKWTVIKEVMHWISQVPRDGREPHGTSTTSGYRTSQFAQANVENGQLNRGSVGNATPSKTGLIFRARKCSLTRLVADLKFSLEPANEIKRHERHERFLRIFHRVSRRPLRLCYCRSSYYYGCLGNREVAQKR